MNSRADQQPILYRFSALAIALIALLAALLYVAFDKAIGFMVGQWSMEEFSHGYLIPFIALFLVWQRRTELMQLEFRGSWAGPVVVVIGIALDIAGRAGSLWPFQHLALLIVIAGLVLSLGGWEALRILRVPLGILIFMIPLPNLLMGALSAELQLVSSALGVWLMRLAGVAVFLQGNVIDLGSYKLEVAEACSGLRYLLPLMTIGFLAACFYRAPLWKRLVVFLSSIPITVVMNSLRIAAIGVMVDRWGIGMAEGLLHQVQGWMMFMLSTAILVLEVIVLTKIGKDRRPWREVFGFEFPGPLPAGATLRRRALPPSLLASSAVVLLFSAAMLAMPAPRQLVPPRDTFTSFPLQLNDWSGRRQAMESIYLDTLKLDDYLLANYGRSGANPINLYIAWYDSQSAGASTHSPRACLPGGGWRIEDLRQTPIARVRVGAGPLRVNRAVISYGDQRELVYYWFLQRGRVVTNEYLVKWYLLEDALLRHRTDGALVRLIIPLAPGVTEAAADGELQAFATAVVPRLGRFIPG
jgi:exosortase D (VPLPA-CTERM-specific)